MKQQDTYKVLNSLIKTSEDGVKGFAEAAEKSTDPKLQILFRERSGECEKAAQELQEAVQSLGGEPETRGSIPGAAHRGWVAIKAAAVGDRNVAVLEEVERGEDYAKAAYSRALKADLPATVRGVVERQYQGVMRNHDRIRGLRDQFRSAAA